MIRYLNLFITKIEMLTESIANIRITKGLDIENHEVKIFQVDQVKKNCMIIRKQKKKKSKD